MNSHADRLAALEIARQNVAAFRAQWETAKTAKARNLAADELEFWVSRATMLSNEKGWAF